MISTRYRSGTALINFLTVSTGKGSTFGRSTSGRLILHDPVGYRALEDGRDPGLHDLHRRGCQCPAFSIGGGCVLTGLNLRPADRSQGAITDLGIHMPT